MAGVRVQRLVVGEPVHGSATTRGLAAGAATVRGAAVGIVVEIHRTRGAPLKDYIPDLQKRWIFKSSHASVALRGILHKNNDEASKKNNFQKKIIKNIYLSKR